ncbi:MAG TPA: CsbD family protein [Pseudonocardiaceae bacterium]|jgi:uncharacterized protein YjbJ (UPF0337 family)|nr:CsbD family protein [Pseudonocardiaceae bacterium]
MSTFDKAKAETQQLVGRAKVAVGKATRNQTLTNTGRRDRTAGEARKQFHRTKDKVVGALRDARSKLKDAQR